MTGSGACYRSKASDASLGAVKHVDTKPYRPQTYTEFIHDYNYHRAHTATGGLTPAQPVHNVTGKCTYRSSHSERNRPCREQAASQPKGLILTTMRRWQSGQMRGAS